MLTQQEIEKMFIDSGALNGHFKLTSGRHSDVIFNALRFCNIPIILLSFAPN